MILNKPKAFDGYIFILIMLAVGVTSLVLGKDTNWDLRNYHYYNGYAFLYGRMDYDIAPAQIQTYLNPLYDIFIFLGIKYLPPKIFGFTLGAIQGTGIWLVYKLSRLVTKDYPAKSSALMAIIAAGTAFFGSGWFSEIGNTMGDSITSIFILLALVLILSCPYPYTMANDNRVLLGAGFLLGFCTGLKLVAAVYFIGFFFSLVLLVDNRHMVTAYALFLGSFAAGIAVSIGFWMLRLWDRFQNPLYPFYNKIFRSDFFEHINFADTRFLPKSLLHQLFYPFFFASKPTLVCELFFRDFRLPVLYLMISIFLIWNLILFVRNGRQKKDLRNDSRKTLFLVFFTVISYVGWQTMFSVYRYVIPLELLTPVVVIAIFSSIMNSSKLSTWLSCGILFLLIISVSPINWGRRPYDENYLSLKATVPLSKFENSTVLMSGGNPTSYVIPFFPSTAKFVRLQSNLIEPGNKNKLQARIDNAISDSQNLKMLITEPSDLNSVKTRGVNVDLKSCDSIVTSTGDEFRICDASVK